LIIFGIIAIIAGLAILFDYRNENHPHIPKPEKSPPATAAKKTSDDRSRKGVEVMGIVQGNVIVAEKLTPETVTDNTEERTAGRYEIESLFVPVEGDIYHRVHHLSERGWADLDYVLMQLSRLPGDAANLLEVLNNPDTSASDVATVCERNVGLTVRILKLVNSPFYGLNSEVDDIKRAVAVLGFNEIRQIVITSSIFMADAFADDPISVEDLWRHSLATARISSWIADRSKIEIRKSFCGTAAMLHDVGKLVLQRWRPAGFQRALDLSKEKQTGLMYEELQTLGLTHALAGILLIHCWHLPESLGWVVKGCHLPVVSPEMPESAVVHFAGQVARYMAIGFDGEKCDERIPDDIREILGIDPETIPEVVSQGFEDFVSNTLDDLKVLINA